MKKILTILALSALLSLSYSDEKLKVALYMAGKEPPSALGVYKVMGGELVKAINKSELYTAINRTEAILAQLDKEHVYQRSGAVDDAQIKALGKQFGVQYLCIAEISELRGNTFYLEAQLVDVETAEVKASSTASSDLRTNQDMMIAAQYVARELVGNAKPESSRQKQQAQQTQAQAPARQGSVSIEMVAVKGGTFMMGCAGNSKACETDEKPARRITVSDFQIGKYPITQRQWMLVMGGNPSFHKGDHLPVGKVSWNDAQAFIKRLNSMTGQKYRLPTEAEWEYAARGGMNSRSFTYAGSNNINEVAWYKQNSRDKCAAVGTKSPNELGIYDMSGNVWEWTGDWKANYSTMPQEETNPTGPMTGSIRVLRGCSWPYDAKYCRVSYRNGSAPGNSGGDVGFRVVLVK